MRLLSPVDETTDVISKAFADDAYVASEATADGHTTTLWTPDAADGDTGLLGLHIDREALNGYPNGISLDIAGDSTWQWGLDAVTTDYVIANNPPVGDQIRVAKGPVGGAPFIEIGRNVGSPSVTRKLRISSDVNDEATTTDMLYLECVQASSPIDHIIKGVWDSNTVFTVASSTGKIVTGSSAHANTYGGTFTGNGVDSHGCAVGLANAAVSGREYGIHSGVPGVRQDGFSIFDWTAVANRFVIMAGGSIVLNPNGALATNATDGFVGLPTMAGTPSGTPTAWTGSAFVVYDTSAGKLWVYNGGWAEAGSGTFAPLAGATFTGDVVVPDEAYDATAWNGSLEVPTKNAVRDKIEALTAMDAGAVGFVDGGATAGTARPSGYATVLWRASGATNFTNAVAGDLRIRPS